MKKPGKTALPQVSKPANLHVQEAPELLVPLGSMAYMRPNYIAVSAWIEHVPFAFWLVEALRPSGVVELGTHWGVSYFAFCQALDKLGLNAHAYAVDLWTGDEHSGHYGPEVFAAVKGHSVKNYSQSSTLMKSSFDDAVAYFADGTVDLLHIDGLHTYEAVKHDFETWLPKLSARGVIVMHDTNVRERGFGVFQLFAELRKTYPVFEFTHGHGLGIVGVGAEQTERMQALFDAERDEQQRRDLHVTFSALGRGILNTQIVQRQEGSLAQLSKIKADLAKQEEAAKQAEAKVAALVADVQKRTEDAKVLNAQRSEAQAALAELRKTQEESGGPELIKQLKLDLAKQVETAKQASESAAARAAELRKLQEETGGLERVNQIKAELAKQAEIAKAADDKVVALTADLQKRAAEAQALTTQRNEAQAQVATLRKAQEEAKANSDAAKAALETELARQAHVIRSNDSKLAIAEQSRNEQAALAAEREQALAEQGRQLAARAEEVAAAERRNQELNAGLVLIQAALDAKEKARAEADWLRGELEALATDRGLRNAELESELRSTVARLQTATQNLTELQSLHDDAIKQAESSVIDLRDLRNQLAETQSALRQRQHETEQNALDIADKSRQLDLAAATSKENDKIINAMKEHVTLLLADVRERQSASAAAEQRLREALTAQNSAFEQEARLRQQVEAEKSETEARLKDRTAEIVTLTRLLMDKEAEANSSVGQLNRVREQASHREAELQAAIAELSRTREAAQRARETKEAELRAAMAELSRTREEAEREREILTEQTRQKEAALQAAAEQQRAAGEFRQSYEELSVQARQKEAELEQIAWQRDNAINQHQVAATTVDRVGTAAGLEIGRAILKMLELPGPWRLLSQQARMSRQMTLLQRSGLFDPDWYLTRYTDVAAAGLDPRRHYVEYGAREGREPNGSLSASRQS